MAASGFDSASDLRLAQADRIFDEAADRLMALLQEAARRLRPFPPFPGALFSFGVEVEPDGVADASIGCVVVTEEGDLKELQIAIDTQGLEAFGGADPLASRNEQLVELELSARQRLLFAHNGLLAVERLLRAQADAVERRAEQS